MSTAFEQQVKEELAAIRKDLSGQGNGRLASIETSLEWIRKGQDTMISRLDKACEDAEDARNRQTVLEGRVDAEHRQLFEAVNELEKSMEDRRKEIAALQKEQLGIKRQDWVTASIASLPGLAPLIAAAFGIKIP